MARCLYKNERVSTRNCFSCVYYPGEVISVGEFKRVNGYTVCCSAMRMDDMKSMEGGASGGIVLSDNNQVAGIMIGTEIGRPWIVYFIPALEICYRFKVGVGK